MAYTTHNFQSGDKLYAAQLNEMDTQIAANTEDKVHLTCYKAKHKKVILDAISNNRIHISNKIEALHVRTFER